MKLQHLVFSVVSCLWSCDECILVPALLLHFPVQLFLPVRVAFMPHHPSFLEERDGQPAGPRLERISALRLELAEWSELYFQLLP